MSEHKCNCDEEHCEYCSKDVDPNTLPLKTLKLKKDVPFIIKVCANIVSLTFIFHTVAYSLGVALAVQKRAYINLNNLRKLLETMRMMA